MECGARMSMPALSAEAQGQARPSGPCCFAVGVLVKSLDFQTSLNTYTVYYWLLYYGVSQCRTSSRHRVLKTMAGAHMWLVFFVSLPTVSVDASVVTGTGFVYTACLQANVCTEEAEPRSPASYMY